MFRILHRPASILLAAMLVVSFACVVHAQSAAAERQNVGISYRGYVFGIPVMKADVAAAMAGQSYAARADFETAGLFAVFRQVKVTATTSGYVHGDELDTLDYWHKELDGRKNRELFMTYGPDNVRLKVSPPLHSMGQPPATMAQRLEASDPVSAILQLALRAANEPEGQQCTGTIKVFDGKQRYDLKLSNLGPEPVRTRAYSGPALKCQVRYVPVAGFDPDDLPKPEDVQHPITMWLAETPIAGLRLPVRFTGHFGFGRTVVEARTIRNNPD